MDEAQDACDLLDEEYTGLQDDIDKANVDWEDLEYCAEITADDKDNAQMYRDEINRLN